MIQVEPKELLLGKSDLPQEGEYFLPGPSWTSPSHNSEVVAIRTVEEGQKYLEETGRIDGWWGSSLTKQFQPIDQFIKCTSKPPIIIPHRKTKDVVFHHLFHDPLSATDCSSSRPAVTS
jgi:hypothetical protein